MTAEKSPYREALERFIERTRPGGPDNRKILNDIINALPAGTAILTLECPLATCPVCDSRPVAVPGLTGPGSAESEVAFAGQLMPSGAVVMAVPICRSCWERWNATDRARQTWYLEKVHAAAKEYFKSQVMRMLGVSDG